MSSVDPNGKEAIRRREVGERTGGLSGVGSLVRVLDESRLKPKAKEQEVLDVATEYFLQHGYRGASINAMARRSTATSAASSSCSRPSSAASSSSIGATSTGSMRRCAAWTCGRR